MLTAFPIPVRIDGMSKSGTDQKVTTTSASSATKQRVNLGAAELNRLAMMRYRRRNWLLGLGLLTGVMSIFGYSIFAVRQESLDLDELDEPVDDSSIVSK